MVAGDGRHACAVGFGDLHRERAHAAGRAVDEYVLTALNLSQIAQPLEGREAGQGDRGRFVKCQIARFARGQALGDRGVFGARAPRKRREHRVDRVAGANARDLLSHARRLAREIRTRDDGKP